MAEPLITKYRPQAWDELVGHEPIVAALRKAIARDTCPHAYLLTGPSGTGKTTIARIIAKELKCDIMEIDAASNSGVDDMRNLVELGGHMALSGSGRRAIIIDECHTLSKSAWQALLKLLEEPPAHLFLMLCTTEIAKIPETIITRCYHVPLRSVHPNDLADLLSAIAGAEEWSVKDDVINAVLQHAGGSPRKALSILQAVHDVEDRNEVTRIVALQEASGTLIELMQNLLKGKTSWAAVQRTLARIEDDEYEQALIAAGRYVATVMVRTEKQDVAYQAWRILDAITFPTTTFDRKLHFLTAIGRIVFTAKGVE